MTETSEVIREAAFRLFGEHGYDATSVEEIVAAAGVSRSTFFRTFGSKEAVIFPDHDQLLDRVEERLRTSHADSALAGVTDAVKIVLFHYVGEGERARERYRLTSSVPALKHRELVSTARYQRLFRRYLGEWGDGFSAAELQAEVTSAAVVAAHNHVLRRWLRGQCEDPESEIVEALGKVHHTFALRQSDSPAAIVVVPAGSRMTDVQSAIRAALATWL